MNEPEDREERIAPAQMAMIQNAKIYYKNLMIAMDAGAWRQALSSCENLERTLKKVVEFENSSY